MYFLSFWGILSAVNCQNGDVWGNCTICDYEKPTIEDGCTCEFKNLDFKM